MCGLMPHHIIYYDYPFSTPAENAVNKRIIERPYASRLKFCIAAVFVVCQRDNHVIYYSTLTLKTPYLLRIFIISAVISSPLTAMGTDG